MIDPRTVVERTVLAIALFGGIAAASPAFGQSGEMARVAARDAQSLCADYVDQDRSIVAQLESDGWALETPYESPFLSDLSGTREYDGLGTAYIYAFVEAYPNQKMAFCLVDIYVTLEAFDIAEIGADPALAGEIVTTDTGTYGSWESRNGAEHSLVLAHYADGDFHYQITRLTPSTNRPWLLWKTNGAGQ